MIEREKEVEIRLTGSDWGPLAVRSLIKVFIIALLTLQFWPGMSLFGNYWIVMIILFISYFQMPTTYYTDEPYKVLEAWTRPVIGLLLSLVILFALSPGSNLGIWLLFLSSGAAIGVAVFYAIGGAYKLPWWVSMALVISSVLLIFIFGLGSYFGTAGGLPQAAPLFFLTLAFFATPPEGIDRSEETGEKIKWGVRKK